MIFRLEPVKTNVTASFKEQIDDKDGRALSEGLESEAVAVEDSAIEI